MATVTAPELELNHARGEIKFIVGYQNVRSGNFVKICQGRNWGAATVHVLHGLKQVHPLPFPVHLGQQALAAGVRTKIQIISVGDFVNKPEPGIMPSPLVVSCWVAQPNNQLVCQARPRITEIAALALFFCIDRPICVDARHRPVISAMG